MKIIDRLNEDRINISFEVFPPKTDAGFANVQRATDEIAKLDPSYISVTYGAGGGTSKNTAKIASHIKDDLHVLSLAHLTCASSTKEEVREVIRNLKELGIENILALRGDIPEGMKFPDGDRFHYAYELVEEIRKQGDFCIGAACYPEGHVENEHKEDDIRFLKQKVDCGVDFLTTQMFFDNDIHYNFLYRIREAGITVPVLPGIMPITSAAQMKRSQELSGTVFPRRFLALLDRFGSSPEAMMQAGIAYATDQIIDLRQLLLHIRLIQHLVQNILNMYDTDNIINIIQIYRITGISHIPDFCQHFLQRAGAVQCHDLLAMSHNILRLFLIQGKNIIDHLRFTFLQHTILMPFIYHGHNFLLCQIFSGRPPSLSKYSLKTFSECIKRTTVILHCLILLLCNLQFQTDSQRLSYFFHNFTVQMTDFIFQAHFIYGSQLLQQNHRIFHHMIADCVQLDMGR